MVPHQGRVGNICQKGGVSSKVILTVTVETHFPIVRCCLSALICCWLDVSCWCTVCFAGLIVAHCWFLSLGAGCWFTVRFAGFVTVHCWFACLAGLWWFCPAIRWGRMPVFGLWCRYVTREINCCVFNDSLLWSDYFVWDRCQQVVAHGSYVCGRGYRRGPC